MADLTTEDFEAAKARGDARMRGPRAASAHYDAGRHRVIVRLTTGVELGLAPRDVGGLHDASTEDLKAIEIEHFDLGRSPASPPGPRPATSARPFRAFRAPRRDPVPDHRIRCPRRRLPGLRGPSWRPG